jgi:hypothetical protein
VAKTLTITNCIVSMISITQRITKLVIECMWGSMKKCGLVPACSKPSVRLDG